MNVQYTTSSDGIGIAYDVSGANDHPALILMHGFNGSHQDWHEYGVVEKLSTDFQVITFDCRGRGESDSPTDPQYYSAEVHLDDIHAVANACGVDQFYYWGWSFGATVGFHLTAYSARVIRSVLCGSYFGPLKGYGTADVETMIEMLRPIAHAKANGVLDTLELSDHERWLTERVDFEVHFARLRAFATWERLSPSDMKRPALIYTGSEDGNVVDTLRRQRSDIEAAGLVFDCFEGLTHLGLVAETAVVLPMVMKFLKGN